MSSPYVILGNRPLDQWKVTELKEELKKRKLTTRGLKEDLVKRLDEAVRSELENSANVSEDNDVQSDIPSEPIKEQLFVSNEVNDVADIETRKGKNAAATTDNLENVNTESFTEDKVIEVGLAHEVPENVNKVISNEAVEPAKSLNESHSENGGLTKDGDTAAANTEGLLSSGEDPKVDFIPENPSAGANFSASETQNGEEINTISQVDALTSISDPALHPSFSEKKDDLIAGKDDSDAAEIQDVNETMVDGSSRGNISSVKNIDVGDLGSEKLDLDRSPGDDSMEEDVPEVKQFDSEHGSKEHVDASEISLLPTPVEDDVDVVGHPTSIETEPKGVGKKPSSNSTSVKRKLHDEEITTNDDPVKKARIWNTETSKNSEPVASEEQTKERVVPPSLKPPTNSLRIDRFLRPFTLKAVQELLGRTGSVTSFWMDHIKTHCYVSYSTIEEAEKTRNAVYNLQWPPNGERLLVADFVDPQEVEARMNPPPAPLNFGFPLGPTTVQPPLHRQPLLSPEENSSRGGVVLLPPPPPPPLLLEDNFDPPMLTLDDLFRKTKAIPRIYYLPLSDEQVAARQQSARKNPTE